MPCLRQTTSTFSPAAASFSTPTICSFVNRLFRIAASFAWEALPDQVAVFPGGRSKGHALGEGADQNEQHRSVQPAQLAADRAGLQRLTSLRTDSTSTPPGAAAFVGPEQSNWRVFRNPVAPRVAGVTMSGGRDRTF